MFKHQMEKFKETKVGRFVASHEKTIKRVALITGVVAGAVLVKRCDAKKKEDTLCLPQNEDTPALKSPREEITLDGYSESVIEEPDVIEPEHQEENVNNE